jgi:hypothetical protein
MIMLDVCGQFASSKLVRTSSDGQWTYPTRTAVKQPAFQDDVISASGCPA